VDLFAPLNPSTSLLTRLQECATFHQVAGIIWNRSSTHSIGFLRFPHPQLANDDVVGLMYAAQWHSLLVELTVLLSMIRFGPCLMLMCPCDLPLTETAPDGSRCFSWSDSQDHVSTQDFEFARITSAGPLWDHNKSQKDLYHPDPVSSSLQHQSSLEEEANRVDFIRAVSAAPLPGTNSHNTPKQDFTPQATASIAPCIS